MAGTVSSPSCLLHGMDLGAFKRCSKINDSESRSPRSHRCVLLLFPLPGLSPSHRQTHLSGPSLGAPPRKSLPHLLLPCVWLRGADLCLVAVFFSVGLLVHLFVYPSVSPIGQGVPWGTGLCLIHLWEPRDVPRVHREQTPGECAPQRALESSPHALGFQFAE